MIQFDLEPEDFPEDIEFVSEEGEAFVNGEQNSLASTSWKTMLISWLRLTTMIALPIGFVFSVLMSIGSDHFRFSPLVLTLGMSPFIVFYAFRMRQRLFTDGRVTIGIVERYQQTITSSFRGYRKGIRVWYRFTTNMGDDVSLFMLADGDYKLANGRKAPEIGTPVVVLYINKKFGTLL